MPRINYKHSEATREKMRKNNARYWLGKKNLNNIISYTCEDCGVVKSSTIWNFRKRHSDKVRCVTCQTKLNNAKRKAEGKYSHSEETLIKMRKPHPSMVGNPNGFKKGNIPWNKGTKGAQKGWSKGKHLVDPDFRKLNDRVHDNCSNMVGRILRIKNESKAMKTFEYLGYTKTDFMQHIEKQFTDGMRWENYGKWQVDHIKPVNAFVKEGIVDVREINQLSNLQPLWKIDNIRKRHNYA